MGPPLSRPARSAAKLSLPRLRPARITPDGKLIPTVSGIRSPGGVGFNAEGELFYTDNQGPWNGTCELKLLQPGKFVGHPGGFKWYDLPEAQAAMGKAAGTGERQPLRRRGEDP